MKQLARQLRKLELIRQVRVRHKLERVRFPFVSLEFNRHLSIGEVSRAARHSNLHVEPVSGEAYLLGLVPKHVHRGARPFVCVFLLPSTRVNASRFEIVGEQKKFPREQRSQLISFFRRLRLRQVQK